MVQGQLFRMDLPAPSTASIAVDVLASLERTRLRAIAERCANYGCAMVRVCDTCSECGERFAVAYRCQRCRTLSKRFTTNCPMCRAPSSTRDEIRANGIVDQYLDGHGNPHPIWKP